MLTTPARCASSRPPAGAARLCGLRSITARRPARLALAVAKLFGEAPQQQIEGDLRRFKNIMEAGEIPTTTGQPEGKRSAIGAMLKPKQRPDRARALESAQPKKPAQPQEAAGAGSLRRIIPRQRPARLERHGGEW